MNGRLSGWAKIAAAGIALCILLWFPSPSVASDSIGLKPVAFTFDDGPDPVITPQIVQLLRQYHMKGTFFMIGAHAAANPELVKQVSGEGHEIGNHTFSHPYLIELTDDEIVEEIETTTAVINKLTGQPPLFVRPPQGVINTAGVETIRKLGYQPVFWTSNSRDSRNPGTDAITRYVLNDLKPYRIFVFHDCCGPERQQTVEALKRILPEVEKRGLRGVTVSQLMNANSRQD